MAYPSRLLSQLPWYCPFVHCSNFHDRPHDYLPDFHYPHWLYTSCRGIILDFTVSFLGIDFTFTVSFRDIALTFNRPSFHYIVITFEGIALTFSVSIFMKSYLCFPIKFPPHPFFVFVFIFQWLLFFLNTRVHKKKSTPSGWARFLPERIKWWAWWCGCSCHVLYIVVRDAYNSS